MAEVRFKKREVVSKDTVNAVVFESPDKRIQVVAKPRWMKDTLLTENIRMFASRPGISLTIDKMMAALGLELLYHEGWNITLRTAWAAKEVDVDNPDRIRTHLERAIEESRDKKRFKGIIPLS